MGENERRAQAHNVEGKRFHQRRHQQGYKAVCCVRTSSRDTNGIQLEVFGLVNWRHSHNSRYRARGCLTGLDTSLAEKRRTSSF